MGANNRVKMKTINLLVGVVDIILLVGGEEKYLRCESCGNS